jgi:hypothetical protein
MIFNLWCMLPGVTRDDYWGQGGEAFRTKITFASQYIDALPSDKLLPTDHRMTKGLQL